MAVSQEIKNYTGGCFKVVGRSVEEVLSVVQEWNGSRTGDRFLYLSVRGCSRSDVRKEERKVAIDFLYILPGRTDSKGEHNAFFQKHRDLLESRFGGSNVRYDVSSPVTIVRFGSD